MDESFFCLRLPPSKSNYTNVKGLEDSGYTKMPQMEESLARYLAIPQASSWKAPTLPLKPCCCGSGHSLAALIVTERHLWLNLSGLKKKDRSFLLDAPVSPAGLFRTAVETVVRKFREAKVKSAVFEHYIPRHRQRPSIQPPKAELATGPSWRQGQKASVAARALPLRSQCAGQRPRSRKR